MKTRLQALFSVLVYPILLLVSAPVFANNLHMVDGNATAGFALFRASLPTENDVREFCKLGIQEMMVMSGDAEKHELTFAPRVCPGLKVIYNVEQDLTVPLTASFLNYFDNWIAEARAEGKRVAFRCVRGAHRTGRLAAYYQMKYQGLSVDDATVILYQLGHAMWWGKHRHVKDQVQSLFEFIHSRPCNTEKQFCVGLD